MRKAESVVSPVIKQHKFIFKQIRNVLLRSSHQNRLNVIKDDVQQQKENKKQDRKSNEKSTLRDHNNVRVIENRVDA